MSILPSSGAARARRPVPYTPTPAGPSNVRPLSPRERLPLVDVLRGVATLGVLVAYTFWNLGSPPSETWSRADRILEPVTEIFVDGKFIAIFAFLFGVGTAQQWRRIEAQRQSVARIHLRRMSFLLVAGLLHAVLLRNGDILAPYAILGFTLLMVRRWSNRQLVVAVVVASLLSYAVQAAMYGAGLTPSLRPAGGGGSGWTAYWSENFEWLRYWYRTQPLLSWPRILAVMLAGVLADRVRFIPRVASEPRLARRVLALTLPLAIVGRVGLEALGAYWAPQELSVLRGVVRNETYHLAAWSLAGGYIAAFALLCQRPAWPARLSSLRAVGRMAFTNYIVQAVIVVPVCLVLGLFDAVTPTLALLLALGVMSIQIPFSVWWLKRFDYGPVEAAWRRATYGAWPSAKS